MFRHKCRCRGDALARLVLRGSSSLRDGVGGARSALSDSVYGVKIEGAGPAAKGPRERRLAADDR
jgi:hypothetical protein